MSARTPFIPNSRPASRTAVAKDNISMPAKDPPFAPDFENPLHIDVLKSSPSLKISSNKGADTSDHKSSSANNVSKITKLNGLLKKSSGPLNLSGRKSNANQSNTTDESLPLSTTIKTLSARREQAGTPSVFAPKPLNAILAADLLSSSSFKTPALPSSSVTSMHIADDTHISTNNEDNSHPVSQYKFGNAPPQRVLLHSDDPTARNNPGSISMNGLIPKHGHRDHDRASKKRGRADLDADDDVMYVSHLDSGPAKRYKTNVQMHVGLDARSYMEDEIECHPHPQSRFSPQLLSSPIERGESPQSAGHGHGHDYTSPSEHHAQGFGQHQHLYLQRMPLDDIGNGDGVGHDGGIGPPSLSNGSNASAERGGDALDKLLGCQADAYIEDRMEKYEQLTEKWKDCSMEEWVKGAEEIMVKYTKILDFVKIHMATKLKLFTSFDQQLAAHSAVLDDRAKALDGVKSKLVAQSGSILA